MAVDNETSPATTSFSSGSHILSWPIFGETATAQYIADAITVTDITDQPPMARILPHHSTSVAPSLHSAGLDQTFTQLVERFIFMVHTKLPFLDIPHLRQCASTVAELGPGWDVPSCLTVSFNGLNPLPPLIQSDVKTL